MTLNFKKAMFIALLIVMLTACEENQQNDSIRHSYDANKHYEIKVAHVKASLFERRFGQLLQEQFPNVDIVVVDDGFLEERNKGEWLEQHKPDLVMLFNQEEYQQLASEGYLADLESFIENDAFDLDSYIPEILEILRDNNQHRLYGLSTHFGNEALFFNRTIFEQAQVEFPSSTLSWSDVMRLSQQIKSSENLGADTVGFFNRFQSPGLLLLAWGESEGVDFIYEDEDDLKVTLNTEAWSSIWHEFIHSYQAGLITDETESTFFPANTAMYIGNFLDYRQFVNRNLDQEWGMVHYPANSIQEISNSRLFLNTVMAIYSESPNREVAWEMLKYLNSDEVAQVEMNSVQDLGFSTRQKWNLGNEQVNAEVFYPAPNDAFLRKSSSEHKSIVLKHANRLINEVLQDKIDADTALTLWQGDVEAEILNQN